MQGLGSHLQNVGRGGQSMCLPPFLMGNLDCAKKSGKNLECLPPTFRKKFLITDILGFARLSKS